MKKIISAALALLMTLSLISVGAPAAWADVPTQAGKVFAGYYTDSTYTTPSSTETSYPKFADENVLTVKYQLIVGEDSDAANENNTTGTKLRVVTTVDSLNYREIGLDVKVGDADWKTFTSTKVAKKITGKDGLATLTYEPSYFSEDSQWLCAFNFNLSAEKFSMELKFRPYWVTMGGQKVYGTYQYAADTDYRAITLSEDGYFNNIMVSDAAGLRNIASRSASEDFARWTVRLTADIDLNPGWTADANGGAGTTPTAWTPIGSTTKPFAGTFDGQGHTISGLYLNTTAMYQGLFSGTGNAAVIRDFKLKNSFLRSTAHQLGSIAGNACGTFEKIYSDAIVFANGGAYIGGLIGSTGTIGTVTMEDCWFAGNVSINTRQNYLGGIIGQVANSGTTIKNCLCTGEVYNHAGEGGAYGAALQNIGTACFVGWLQSGKSLTISHGVNHSRPKSGTSGATSLGYFVGKNDGVLTLENCHTIGESGMALVQSGTPADSTYTTNGTCSRQDKTTVAGTKSYSVAKVTNLFKDDALGHWAFSADSLPVLTTFADECAAGAQAVDTSWYDAAKNTYTLLDAGDFYGFAILSQSDNFSGKTVKLGADITANSGEASGWASSAPAFNWIPVGSTGTPFAGTFDGQGNTISGIYLNAKVATQGLFVKTASTATLKDFKLKNSYLTVNTGNANDNCFGSIAGQAAGTFEKIYSDAIVDGYLQRVGGLVGQTSGALSLADCWFAGEANIRTNSSYLGGLVGEVTYNTAIDNCVNTGAVHMYGAPGWAGVSGIVGNAQSTTLTITNTVNHSEPQYTSASSNFIGLLVGRNGGTVTVTNSHSISYNNLNGSANMLVNGRSDGADCGRFTKEQAKGLTGYNTFAKIRALFEGTAAGHWSITADSLPVLAYFADEYAAGTVAIDTDWYGDGSADTFTLMDAGDLYGFAILAKTNSFAGKTVKLGADVTVNSDMDNPTLEWISIAESSSCKFQGTFDGQGHTISGLYQVKHAQLQGFFGDVSGATIKNFRLVDSYFAYTSGGHDMALIGAVAGRASGTFENIYTNATVVSVGRDAAGFVGMTQGTVTITNCWNAGNITGEGAKAYEIGGFVGSAAHPVNLSYCLNSGTIGTTLTGGDANIGGFVGKGSDAAVVNLSYCLNTGMIDVDTENVTATTYGTIVGSFNASKGTFVQSATLNVFGEDGHEYNGTGNTSNVKTRSIDVLKGTGLAEELPNFFMQVDESGTPYWTAVEGDTPVLTTFATFADAQTKTLTLDLSWYGDGSADTFTLMDAGDLYGFAILAKTNSFAGKTVKLGADVTVNSDMDNPTLEWISIAESSSCKFQGTFDGQGHTISGLYQVKHAQLQGLFGDVSQATIKNFRLVDSYFEYTSGGNSNALIGAVAGRASGTFENIYTNATVVSAGECSAGFVGLTQGAVTIINCWNDGDVTGQGANASGIGGFVGAAYHTVTLSYCHNSGTIGTTLTGGDANIGGFVGKGSDAAVINLSYCLNTGTIDVDTESVGNTYGSIVGNFNASKGTFVQSAAWDQFGDEGHEYNGTGNTGNVKTRSIEIIKGTGLAEELPNFFMQVNESDVPYWTPVEDAAPVLTTFADIQSNSTLAYYANTGYAAAAADVSQLSALYTGRTLYQGELHDHADTSVGSDAGTSDGHTEITEWYSQMPTLGLDFAASLDHRQASHIDLSVWDKSKMLYGTEMGAYIPNVSGQGKMQRNVDSTDNGYTGTDTWNQHHYNMLFRTKSQMEAVLNAYSQFRYLNSTNTNVSWDSGRTNNGKQEFVNWNPTRAQFTALIQSVQQNGGFFVLPHTSSTNAYNSGQAVDYDFGVDGVGFEVIYGLDDHASDNILYSRWKELLASGAKMYACAGTDGHADLENTALTSIYGASAAASDKGYLIDQLRAGDFTAGSAGIKMCVGGTAMGGTGSFAGQRVVVDVEKIHALANDLSHKYRLYVFSDAGLMCCKDLAVNASTGVSDGVELAFDADPSCTFYRVEVRDDTTGTRIAIGNPIWNG